MKKKTVLLFILGLAITFPAKAQWTNYDTQSTIRGVFGLANAALESAERKKEMEILARQKVEFEQSFQDAMTEAKDLESKENWEEALAKYEEAAKLNCKYSYTDQRQITRKINGLYEKAGRAFNEAEATPIDFLLKDITVPANYDESQDAADMAKVRAAMDKHFSEDDPTMAPVVKVVNNHSSGQAVYLVVKNDDHVVYTSSQGSYSLTDYPGFICIVNLQGNYANVDYMDATILCWYNYYCQPITDVAHLQLTDWQDIEEEEADISDVVFTRQATLTDISDEETIQMKILPAQVKYGKDSLGNEYYVCF